MELEPAAISREQAAALYPTLLTPRPVVLIGTSDAKTGLADLAPYSSVSFVANHPPMVTISISQRHGMQKNTLRNIEAGGRFVINMLTKALSEVALRAAETSDATKPIDWYMRLGINRADFAEFAAGRVADAPIALGCRLSAIHDLTPSSARLVVAEITRIYCRDDWLSHAEHAPKCYDVLASVAAEQYIALGEAEEFFLKRTWE